MSVNLKNGWVDDGERVDDEWMDGWRMMAEWMDDGWVESDGWLAG